jgi:hypothetical protein
MIGTPTRSEKRNQNGGKWFRAMTSVSSAIEIF